MLHVITVRRIEVQVLQLSQSTFHGSQATEFCVLPLRPLLVVPSQAIDFASGVVQPLQNGSEQSLVVTHQNLRATVTVSDARDTAVYSHLEASLRKTLDSSITKMWSHSLPWALCAVIA